MYDFVYLMVNNHGLEITYLNFGTGCLCHGCFLTATNTGGVIWIAMVVREMNTNLYFCRCRILSQPLKIASSPYMVPLYSRCSLI